MNQCKGLLEKGSLRKRKEATWKLGFGGLNGGSERQNGVNLRDFEQVHHPAVCAGDHQLRAIRLASDVVIHHQAHACGVHVGYIAEIDDREGRQRRPSQFALQLEKIPQSERALQAENPCAWVFAISAIDRKGAVVQHSEVKCMKWGTLDDYSSVNVAQAGEGRPTISEQGEENFSAGVMKGETKQNSSRG